MDDALARKGQLMIFLRLKVNVNLPSNEQMTVQDKLAIRRTLVSKGGNKIFVDNKYRFKQKIKSRGKSELKMSSKNTNSVKMSTKQDEGP